MGKGLLGYLQAAEDLQPKFQSYTLNHLSDSTDWNKLESRVQTKSTGGLDSVLDYFNSIDKGRSTWRRKGNKKMEMQDEDEQWREIGSMSENKYSLEGSTWRWKTWYSDLDFCMSADFIHVLVEFLDSFSGFPDEAVWGTLW